MEETEREMSSINLVRKLTAKIKAMNVYITGQEVAMNVPSGLPAWLDHIIVELTIKSR